MSSIVGRFLSGRYTVIRSRGVTYERGRPVSSGTETLSVLGSLQPATPREAKMPEEGGRLMQRWSFYSDQPLLAIGTAPLAGADRVTILDETRGTRETYKVLGVEIWRHFSLEYYKATLVREPEQ